MIVLDLEWNRGYDKTPLDEILQIGAVRLDRPGGPIVDSFCVFSRPTVHKKLNRTAKELPEIQASLDSGLDFPDAYRQFIRWCGGETEFAAWGCDELDILGQNAARWKLPPLKPAAVCDLQTAFALTLGTIQNLALWWAVEYCQIPDCFSYHNALNDAMYTALLTAWIRPEFLELASRPRWMLRYLLRPYPAHPGHPVGPHPSRAAALNGRDARKAACPTCGAHFWIQGWEFDQHNTYYTDLRCPDHGHFICRLSLSPGPDGQWRGIHDVPPPALPMLEEFGRARAGGPDMGQGAAKRRGRRPGPGKGSPK